MLVLFECAVRSAVLLAIVWLMLKLLRVRNPRLERLAWLAVLTASLAMPLLTKLAALSATPVTDIVWLQPVQVAAVDVSHSNNGWYAALRAAVIAIAGVLGLRHTLGIWRWWRVRDTAAAVSTPLCIDADVRITRAVESPATVFSTILVPVEFEGWTAQVQRAVIAHERTHVANRDFYVQWAAQLHRCIFWFNPLAWWLARRLATLSEHISDDAAVDVTEERAEYAELLLGFAGKVTRSEHLLQMAGSRTLASRIERILGDRQPPRAGVTKTLVVTATLLSAVILVAGSWPAAALSGNLVLPKSNPQRPLSQPIYPAASQRLGEHGTVVLRLHVLEDGSVADVRIDQSSGYPDLDYAAYYESFRWRIDPGTVDGVPSRMWGKFAVTFKLTD
ncbi:MAG TPA: M56 family metallopeptidase [Steroidobacteraceae bacterium]|nr:M56 family metallopeptidase [Steroidobacteraceae bacterium]